MDSASPPVRQNFHAECEAALNVQARLQLYAAYVYLSMAVYCDRSDVALPHLARAFLRRARRWRQLAEQLLLLQTERGGSVVLSDIARPQSDDWRGGAQAVECAFHLEDTLHQSLLELHGLVAARGDPHLGSILQRRYLRPQARVLGELGAHLNRLRSLGSHLPGLESCLCDGLNLDDDPCI
ncbi:ferritin heavy chain-like [Cavia porcellus]|uniref:ferritin heavy chain-like n=1 Tax=Cavia porcellus TaxID=10141 RepID=UPI002FDFF216